MRGGMAAGGTMALCRKLFYKVGLDGSGCLGPACYQYKS